MTRTNRIVRFLLLTSLAVLIVAVPSAKASPHFFIQVGIPIPIAPVVVAPPVIPPHPVYGYGYVWRAGYYNWNGYAYGWMPGAWVRPPFAGGVWVGPRWVSHAHGAYWAHGYWRHR